MIWTTLFLSAVALVVVALARAARRAGPRQLAQSDLDGARTVLDIAAGDQGAGWDSLGRLTRSRGLDLRFDHDDDPQAEATMLVPAAEPSARNTLANRVTIRLTSELETHHVHTGGFVFRVCLRGTGNVIGKETIIQMLIDRAGKAYGARVENDDDTDAAVGDWIEIQRVEILQTAG